MLMHNPSFHTLTDTMENIMVTQLLNKFPTLRESQWSITMSTKASHFVPYVW